jgi:hypothetical protein
MVSCRHTYHDHAVRDPVSHGIDIMLPVGLDSRTWGDDEGIRPGDQAFAHAVLVPSWRLPGTTGRSCGVMHGS